MPVCKANFATAVRLLGSEHASFIALKATAQDRIEEYWKVRTEFYLDALNAKALELLLEGKSLQDLDLTELLMEHYFAVNEAAISTAQSEQDLIVRRSRLAKPPKADIPKSFRKLREMYDIWRTKGWVPKRQKELAERIKKAYVKKAQDVWRRYTGDFREGKVADKQEALQVIKKGVRGVYSRAKMIVETETTNYYNETRKEVYDQSSAVTHYLFLAIRDQATTKWCTERVVDGKRGRHGLVYAKEDTLTKKETPAIHWNCRSEMVPLTPYNPSHKRLIEDESKHRRSHHCHPLPKGWTK